MSEFLLSIRLDEETRPAIHPVTQSWFPRKASFRESREHSMPKKLWTTTLSLSRRIGMIRERKASFDLGEIVRQNEMSDCKNSFFSFFLVWHVRSTKENFEWNNWFYIIALWHREKSAWRQVSIASKCLWLISCRWRIMRMTWCATLSSRVRREHEAVFSFRYRKRREK